MFLKEKTTVIDKHGKKTASAKTVEDVGGSTKYVGKICSQH
jgi:hypothetical protein